MAWTDGYRWRYLPCWPTTRLALSPRPKNLNAPTLLAPELPIRRRQATLGVSAATMQPFANALRYVIYQGNGMFSGNVDGTSGSVPVRNYIYPQWMLLARFDPALYAITANANITSGWQATHAEFTAFILWMKQQRCLGQYPR